VGSRFVQLQLATIPPGGRAKAHLHVEHETAIYQLSGISGCLFRNQLQHHALVRAGDFFYVPAGTPHLPYNASADEPYVAVIARTEPNGQESVTMRPDLDELADWSTITLLRR
jgi:uncharacterized RmlC-like cupin family protein